MTFEFERGGESNNHTGDASITRSRRGKQDDAGRSNLAQCRTALATTVKKEGIQHRKGNKSQKKKEKEKESTRWKGKEKGRKRRLKKMRKIEE